MSSRNIIEPCRKISKQDGRLRIGARLEGGQMLEQWGFVAVTLALVFAAVSYLPRYPAGFAVGAVIIGVSYLGPQILGQDWFYQGFFGGVVFGGFLEYAMFGMAAPLKSHQREEVKFTRPAGLVLNLKFSNNTTITLEHPSYVPSIGDKVSFVDQHNREVVAREIRYEGSSGPGQCFVSVSFR
jgi:hypothetical protein